MSELAKDSAVRVLVADDSAFMRKVIPKMLSSDRGIEVIAVARNGAEAVELVRQRDPDVVTLDVEMPVMDGLSALTVIMAEMPRPVLMLSSLTTEAAKVTLEALSAGAADFVTKPGGAVSLDVWRISQELCEKVRSLGRRRRQPRARSAPPQLRVAPRPARYEAVVIGASTGGPSALEQLLRQLPRSFPLPILVVQHMPRVFTESLAERLGRMCGIQVRLAAQSMPVQRGHVYLAPGGEHMTVRRSRGQTCCYLGLYPRDKPHCPSVDVLFESAAEVWNRSVLGIVLTGMGNDGQAGAVRLVDAGGTILAQDEESCVVYGMPKAVAETGLASFVGNLDALAGYVRQCCTLPAGVTA